MYRAERFSKEESDPLDDDLARFEDDGGGQSYERQPAARRILLTALGLTPDTADQIARWESEGGPPSSSNGYSEAA